jgi:hypothetical protein
MNTDLTKAEFVPYFNAKTTENVLRKDYETIKLFLCNKWLIEHKNCQKCENNCNSIRELFEFLYMML